MFQKKLSFSLEWKDSQLLRKSLVSDEKDSPDEFSIKLRTNRVNLILEMPLKVAGHVLLTQATTPCGFTSRSTILS